MLYDPAFKELHQQMLILLKKFHEICINNNVKYSLHAGTLLGAIREKGFIPWDDDIDVTLMREDYEKFSAAVRQAKLGKEFHFYDQTELQMARFCMKTFCGDTIWIDLMVYDYISEYKILQKLKIGIILALNATLKTKEWFALTKKRSHAKWQYILYQGAYLLGKLLPFKWKITLKEWISIYCLCGKRKYIHRSNDRYAGLRVILPTEIMREFISVPFEDTEFMVCRQYHQILRTCYDDNYMTPRKPLQDEIQIHSGMHDILNRMMDEP